MNAIDCKNNYSYYNHPQHKKCQQHQQQQQKFATSTNKFEDKSSDAIIRDDHARRKKIEEKQQQDHDIRIKVAEQEQQDAPITDFSDISRAMVAIRDGIRRTTCIQSYFLSELCQATIYLKPEFRQFTGSFKERGARNAILQLLAASSKSEQQKQSKSKSKSSFGVIAASAGNHALALAYHGKELGVPVTVVMPSIAPLLKVDRCRQFGATIIMKGAHIGESKLYAEQLAIEQKLHYINGYDDRAIVAGAGTMGIEIMEDVPNVDIVVVPVGGGGLIAGVSCAIKTLKPSGCKVIGVEPEYCASYTAALKAGKPVPVQVQNTLADGLAVPTVGSHAFQVATKYVDECVLVNEKDISIAVLRLIENEKMVVEGGGATGLAALLPGGSLFGRPDIIGKNIVVPLCGGNIDTTVLGRVLERGLAADNRLLDFYAEVSDRPGGIAKLTQLLSEMGASIKDIYHERAWLHTSVDRVQVKCVVELNGIDHAELLKKALIENGYPIIWKPRE
ncbi:tryptophan synthase beta subunit-like PLP-dependent enzyme [Fragilariopsis cylindrus CCMP1102]|uniref:Tryptophan synthase beta subunit-like PLP-dependent enzyme n=1 Tax=Fragilariopsis cylindrus CCMP1102 TaxID=635003 RepID=A0A1E7F9L3_9STRA|nr:tryptophan synthase beta subunit-like PLP-dependent enzyme [Fragilariopsis cylindrus CCMP1102]|eukprot:OEU14870.1 tryptophan synthase beta subunit-like PLP-dependent enzyme [Fragilariopsis cylindrus CCMP1102]